MYNDLIIVACSGGVDSMMLLDYLYSKGYRIIVGHVNYHKRPTSNRDMLIVNNYCLKRGIPLVIKNANPELCQGNFQNWARLLRYHFFKELCDAYHASSVYVAHQQDDLLETYLMQKEKHLSPSYYGLKDDVTLYGVRVKRPLLKLSRLTILKYLKDNKIEYGIDESNLSDDYRRNQIRHEIIEKLDDNQRQAILKEIEIANQKLSDDKKIVESFLNHQSKVLIKDFKIFNKQESLLRYLLYEDLSQNHLNDLIKAILNSKRFECHIRCKTLVREYDYFEVFDDIKAYEYKFNHLEFGSYQYFELSDSGNKKNGLSLKKEDFPITVRSFKNGDQIKLRFGTKKLSRFFIDNKISSKDRKTWPIVCNRQGDVIFVFGIGCDINHYSIKPDLFVVKL